MMNMELFLTGFIVAFICVVVVGFVRFALETIIRIAVYEFRRTRR